MFGLSLKDKAAFFRQMATLIESGMPIMTCLESLGTMPNSKIRNVIQKITPMIALGDSLSESLAQFPNYFEPVIIQLVKAGEIGGSLEIRLKNVADYLEKMYRLQQQLISRMIYPILLIHAGIFIPPAVVFVLKGMIAYLKATLIPLFFLYLIVFGIYALYNFIRTIPGMREAIDSILLYFPLVGIFFSRQAAYRFMLVLGDLTDAGVEMGLAVSAAAEASGNAAAKLRFEKISEPVATGAPLESSLRNTGLIPDISLQMIRTGEQSGNLPFMLKKAAEMLGQDLDEAIKRVFTVIPVIFYLLVSLYMGYVIIKSFVGIYAPILNPGGP